MRHNLGVHLREGQLERLTLDHDLVHLALRQGCALAEMGEALRRHSTVVTAALGYDRAQEIDVRYVTARPGALYLLCSDGVTRQFPDAEIAAVRARDEDLAARCRHLVEETEARGGRDNAAALLVRHRGQGPERGSAARAFFALDTPIPAGTLGGCMLPCAASHRTPRTSAGEGCCPLTSQGGPDAAHQLPGS